jgi:hypothetical protein
MQIRTEMYKNDDKQGNELYMRVFYNEENQAQNAILHLKLKGSKHPRQIGNLIFSTRTFHCKRDSSKHYHRKTKGYGFNWTILEDATLSIEKIHLVIDDTNHYLFDKSVIKQYGTFLNFKEQGFELQRFLPMEIIKNFSKVDNEN